MCRTPSVVHFTTPSSPLKRNSLFLFRPLCPWWAACDNRTTGLCRQGAGRGVAGSLLKPCAQEQLGLVFRGPVGVSDATPPLDSVSRQHRGSRGPKGKGTCVILPDNSLDQNGLGVGRNDFALNSAGKRSAVVCRLTRARSGPGSNINKR